MIIPATWALRFLTLQAAVRTWLTFDLLLATVQASERQSFARFVCLGQAPLRVHLLPVDVGWNAVSALVYMVYAFACEFSDANILSLALRARRRCSRIGRLLIYCCGVPDLHVLRDGRSKRAGDAVGQIRCRRRLTASFRVGVRVGRIWRHRERLRRKLRRWT